MPLQVRTLQHARTVYNHYVIKHAQTIAILNSDIESCFDTAIESCLMARVFLRSMHARVDSLGLGRIPS